MSRTCPRCRLINPDSVLRCDCGYDFGTGEMKASHLQASQNYKAAAQFQELVEKHGSVEGAFKVIGKRTMLQGVGACIIGIVATAISYVITVHESDESGQGRYVVFTGAIVIGIIQFVRGWSQYRRRN